MRSWAMDEQDFHRCCRLLLEQSKQLRDGWSWEAVQGSEEGYLRKTSLRSVVIDSRPMRKLDRRRSALERRASCRPVPNQRADDKEQLLLGDAPSMGSDTDDEDDLLCVASEGSRQLLQYEYHILYSCSYSTPVLYFRAFTQEGRSLSLEEVWGSVHPNFRLRLQQSPLHTLGLQEHPLLGQPFFMLHPCRTAEFMRPVVQAALDQHRPVNYLLSWLSVVGPVVGLDVPLKYCTQLCPAASTRSVQPD
ncbi:ubiquitin-like-conjugating enzyme ATG10 [Brachionichthys hirsutus]|uniref:ubiquitin-like-conjugating enzyme ATG10 n=1 Tax=Brachionichthys hirsutus TaxID=412623 RepID=UPI00360525AD